jgi:hypothetical protein
MSPTSPPKTASSEPHKPRDPMLRLAQLQRGLQRRLRRKPTVFEKAMLDRCALALLRNEMVSLNGKATANDLVRLSRASGRALADFERACGLDPAPKKAKRRDMRDLAKEIAAHA